LNAEGFEVVVHRGKNPLSKKNLIKRAGNADALITLLFDKIDKEVIDSLSSCKVIANYAVGYNNIDVEYAKSKGITVTNTPGILTDATADLTLALILATSRRVNEAEKFLREGKFRGWRPELLLGTELKGKKIGIIGMGRIGFAAAKRCAAFGMKIYYFSRSKNEKAEKELSAKKVSLNKLLQISDVVSLHVPLNEKTVHLLDSEKLKKMKKGAILINTARGEIVDEETLIELLKKRHLLAAGLDVYEGEPRVNKKFLSLDNVTLLPHIGSSTVESRNAMAELAAKNVVSALKNGRAISHV